MQSNLFTEAEITTVSPAIAKPFVSRSTFYQGDCLMEMDNIADGSVDMILCDLPYGVTNCNWDITLALPELWKQYQRIIKNNGAIILHATNPFAATLVASNYYWYKYDLIWDKVMTSSPSLAKKQPLRSHELILVFYNKQPTYNPQFREDEVKKPFGKIVGTGSSVSGYAGGIECERGVGYPKSIIKEPRQNNLNGGNLHPSQKPLKLAEWLVKTYTNEGETVLDNCMGSGTTGVACKKTGRHFIGIEKDEKYFEIAVSRVSAYCG